MKTYIGYLIFMCSLLLCSCQQTTSNPRFYDEGVSQELATLRKQEIKELKYKLYFSIPEQKSVPVMERLPSNLIWMHRKKLFSTSEKSLKR